MSAQFGKVNLDGKPVDPKDLDQVRPVLAPYGPDGEGNLCKDNFGVLYRAFHTTKESRLEKQPHVLPSGAIMIWDGRLDNRAELISQSQGKLSESSTDLEIASEAYDSGGTDAFRRLIGDWAISVWEPWARSLVLARDFVGTRHLFYCVDSHGITWSTILDPLVLLAGRTWALQEEYIAGWLAFFPAAHLTPYVGIHAVPPSSFVRIRPGSHTVAKYWDFDPGKKIWYQTDDEYEEHFRSVFFEAVRRRLRSDSPVLAELSGGMDSSSIVCVADTVMARGMANAPRLDTVSHYDDSEPNWNERPYFTKVEAQRKRSGCHIDISRLNPLRFEARPERFSALPGSSSECSEIDKRLAELVASQGSRVVLSGIGGDEFTGGVPSAIPELADLLATGEVGRLKQQLKRWALNKRVPWFHLLYEVTREFMPGNLGGNRPQPVSWLRGEFTHSFRFEIARHQARVKLLGPLPSFQQSLKALELLRGQLACYALSAHPPCERRYPYLDRDLIAFLISVPREQLVRPGQRRSLMRRALVEIVPREILDRKRKAFVIRGPLARISGERQKLEELSRNMRSEHLSLIDSRGFLSAIERAGRGQDVPLVPLMRTVALEIWLRNLEYWNCIHLKSIADHQGGAAFVAPNRENHGCDFDRTQALS